MKKKIVWVVLILVVLLLILFFIFPELFDSRVFYSGEDESMTKEQELISQKKPLAPVLLPLDTVAYDVKMLAIANNPPPKLSTTKVVKDPKTGKETTITIEPKPAPLNIWPVKTVYPTVGAILPFKRVVAYYGNLYSKKMGVLGEYPEAEMLRRLDVEVKKWEAADPETPVLPALHYIAVVAQGSAGKDGKYRARMPGAEIEKIL